jgi:hypothetical protein
MERHCFAEVYFSASATLAASRERCARSIEVLTLTAELIGQSRGLLETSRQTLARIGVPPETDGDQASGSGRLTRRRAIRQG